MEFNINEAHNFIVKIINSSLNVADGMNKLLDYCRNYCKDYVWDIIQNIDFESDRADLARWLQYNLESEPPSEEVEAFWIGLFNGIYDNDEVCMIYLSGVACIDNKEEIEEWDFENIYLPEDRYFHLKVLHEISNILKTTSGKTLETGEYILYLGYTCLMIRDILKTIDRKLLLAERNSRQIIVGFDSGDYVVLKAINDNLLI